MGGLGSMNKKLGMCMEQCVWGHGVGVSMNKKVVLGVWGCGVEIIKVLWGW